MKNLKKYLSLANILFIAFIIISFLPDSRPNTNNSYFIVLMIGIEVLYLAILTLAKKRERQQTASDITTIVYVILILWQLFSAKLGTLDKFLFPNPGNVFSLFIEQFPALLSGLWSSSILLFWGYFLALFLAIPLGILIGYKKRAFRAVNPIVKILSPIPPIVFIPYSIALLPTFRASSIFVIFIGVFWPVFTNTLHGVTGIEQQTIDSAKSLNVSDRSMMKNVLLPAAMPSILAGANIGLVFAFILLTSAEMIGATNGIGWYVKYFSDFGQYDKVLVGILFIGLVVSIITFGFDRIKNFLLRWKK